MFKRPSLLAVLLLALVVIVLPAQAAANKAGPSGTPPGPIQTADRVPTRSVSDRWIVRLNNPPLAQAPGISPGFVAMAQGTIPRNALTAEVIRQLRNLRHAGIDAELQKVYGVIRESSVDKQQEIERYKRIYRAGGSQPGDGPRGRAVFARICQQCHTLYEVGGKVGPDLTGSNRADLDYILQNIIDPNAVIPNDYRASNLEMKDGRSMIGLVKAQDDKSVTVITQNETLTLPRDEIQSLRQSELSMMPEGLLAPLSDQETRDLLYYLSRPGQVPLPGETK